MCHGIKTCSKPPPADSSASSGNNGSVTRSSLSEGHVPIRSFNWVAQIIKSRGSQPRAFCHASASRLRRNQRLSAGALANDTTHDCRLSCLFEWAHSSSANSEGRFHQIVTTPARQPQSNIVVAWHGFDTPFSAQGLHTVLEHHWQVKPWLLTPHRKLPQSEHHVGELTVAILNMCTVLRSAASVIVDGDGLGAARIMATCSIAGAGADGHWSAADTC